MGCKVENQLNSRSLRGDRERRETNSIYTLEPAYTLKAFT
jgi:hypothetical protein